MVLNLRLINFHAVPQTLAKFDVVARDGGQTRSGLLRALMVKAVRDAAKAARDAARDAAPSATSQRVQRQTRLAGQK